ncbi:putative Chitinase domain-containing protein, partial [Naja naja]
MPVLGKTRITKVAMKCICVGLVFALASQLVDATLSKTDLKKASTKTMEEKIRHSNRTVQERGLVVTDPTAKDIWNSHGYDIAKTFGNKFTTISPVWLQVKRRGKEKFQVTGLHDVDQGWMKEVKRNAKNIKIAPRILFEDWSYHDFETSENFDGFVLEIWNQLGNQKQMDLIHLLTHFSEAFHEAQLKLMLVIPPGVMP